MGTMIGLCINSTILVIKWRWVIEFERAENSINFTTVVIKAIAIYSKPCPDSRINFTILVIKVSASIHAFDTETY